MNSNITKAIIFLVGVGIGCVSTSQFFKKKYESIAQEEIESVKEHYSKKTTVIKPNVSDSEDPKKIAEAAKEKPGVMEYAKIINGQNYHTDYKSIGSDRIKDFVDTHEGEDEEEYDDEETARILKSDPKMFSEFDDPIADPYTIPPYDLGEQEDFEKVTLYYFADGVLADENYERVENVDKTIGLESLKKFGEYEDDSVCVRNEVLKCDYEILMDQRNYSSIRRA